MAAKVAERERKEAEIAKQEKQIADHKEFVERFRAKATKARQAQSKLKMIDRIEIVKLPRTSRRYPIFKFAQRRPSGKDVLKTEDIAKSYGADKVLDGVELQVRRGDRLAILGPNGIGKSTLLKIVMGAVEADSRQVEWGYETHPGYFAQDHREQLGNPRATVEEWLWNFCPGEPIGFVRGQLGLVLFSGDDVEEARRQPVGRRGGAPPVRADGGREAERAGARRADQPPRPGGDRGAGAGAREVRGHADLRLPRPLVRVAGSRPASSRSRRAASTTSRAPTTSTSSASATITSTPRRCSRARRRTSSARRPSRRRPAEAEAAAPAARGGARGVRGGPEVGRKAGRSDGAREDTAASRSRHRRAPRPAAPPGQDPEVAREARGARSRDQRAVLESRLLPRPRRAIR